MNRNDLIEKLIRSKAETSGSTANNRFYIIYGLFTFLILFLIYSFSVDKAQLSVADFLSFFGGIFILIFFRQFYNFHANVKYAYYVLSLIFYILWFVILAPSAYRDLIANGFPEGYKCLAEIILIGIILGTILKKFIIGDDELRKRVNSWVTFPVAIGTGFFLINILCEIPDSSHDIIWHGFLPILFIFWFFFRKL